MNGPLVSAEVVGEDDYVTRMCASEGSFKSNLRSGMFLNTGKESMIAG